MTVVSLTRMLRMTVGNPITRWIIRRLIKEDENTGKPILELLLERYVDETKKLKGICMLYYPLISFVLGSGQRIFGVKNEDFRSFFKDGVKRKGLVNVLKSISQYGITKPQKLSAPFLVVWDVTYGCNLKCEHCYATAGKMMENELTTEEALNIIDQLSRAGVVALAFAGGEPLMRKDIYELCSYASSKNMYVAIATNGTMITEDVARKLEESGVKYVEVSIDGSKAEIHDRFRGVEGAFERAIEGIRNLTKTNIQTAIAITVTRENFHDFDNVVDLALELGVSRVVEFNFVPTGRGRFIAEKDLRPEEREELLRKMYRKSLELGGRLELFSTAPQYARIALEETKRRGEGEISFTFYGGRVDRRVAEIAEFISGCGAGRLYCAITPDGKVKPCVFMPIIVGDLREKSFQEIWDESELMNMLRDRENLKGSCGKCSYRYVCGGCRSRAYGYFGDPLMPDPGCVNNQKFFEELLSTEESKEACECA
ncbi:MAG: hypothetical protein PWR13_99 [Archaeoglobi archaeon]|nr:hypothetical protein [Archaeoglobi archaeon]MDK2781071.1 hypothetical protein [Archaeoglobi archaeon]